MVTFREKRAEATMWERPETVVFVHAHPDDEAIFTGGTLAALSAHGYRTVVIVATSGELGEEPTPASGRGGATLAEMRRDETRRSCDALGVDRLVFLDHVDSGLETDPYRRPWGAFVDVPVATAARQVAAIAAEERAVAIVGYDDDGIYGHPDHIHVHHVTRLAAELAGVPTRYDATVDREYLHFVEAHLVDHAGEAVPGIRPIGRATVEIDTAVPIHPHLDAKQVAIAAHASQVGADRWLGVPESFADVYGFEWFVRSGPAGPLDELAALDAAVAPTTPAPEPDTPLARQELLDIATGLATAVRHGLAVPAGTGDRAWWRLLATGEYDAWLIAWPQDGSVTPHDHGDSAGAFAVATGVLNELVVDDAGSTERRQLVAGEVHYVPVGTVHDVVNDHPEVALSVHVYSPPLSSMSYVDERGERRSTRVEFEPAAWAFGFGPRHVPEAAPTATATATAK